MGYVKQKFNICNSLANRALALVWPSQTDKFLLSAATYPSCCHLFCLVSLQSLDSCCSASQISLSFMDPDMQPKVMHFFENLGETLGQYKTKKL